jgi:chromosome segregation ATPase
LLLSNTLVCDTMEEARNLAYGGTERHKVVSKDGVLFNRVSTRVLRCG